MDIILYFWKYPGSDDKLLLLCAKDGTKLFENQHWYNEKAKSKLKSFYIGDLK